MSGLTALDIHEIVRCMEATECGAILVPPRILRRVIKLHRRIAGVGFDVPHPHVYVITKARANIQTCRATATHAVTPEVP